MKTRLLFMRANRYFENKCLGAFVTQIEQSRELYSAKSGDKLGPQGARIQVAADLKMPALMCTLCLKTLTVTSLVASTDYQVLDHTCGGDVSKAVSVLVDDQWITGEIRDFHRIWASNEVFFSEFGLSETQALEALERLLRRELAPSRDEEDLYTNSPYYTQRWRDDFLDHKLATGYVFEGGIDKYRWVKN